jgi:hypothetical protein
MSKRLILVLALTLLVAGFTAAAYAEVQNVKVSGDINVLGLVRDPWLTSRNDQTESTIASIARVRVDADLTDNVSATIRLLNERYWGNETSEPGSGGTNTEIDLDLAYVTLKEFLYSPLTLTIGRQELHFGNDMIIGDPDTNNNVSLASAFSGGGTWPRDPDLSARKSFDAGRATLNYDPLVIDLVAATVNETTLNKDDKTELYGINLNYALNKKTTLEGYFWDRRIGSKAGSNNKVDQTYVVGGRVVNTSIDNLTFQLEAAMQLGKVANPTNSGGNPTQVRRAWAMETSLSYDLRNAKKIGKYKPTVTVLYNYFSGQRGSGDKLTAWDPMYENQTAGSLANALFNQSNAHVLGGIATAKPVDDVTLKGEYYAYWWDKRFGNGSGAGIGSPTAVITGEALRMTNKKFVGQEIDATVTYDYTEDVQFGLMGGMFFPGDSFQDGNHGTASEVIGSMKVTF